MSHLFNPLVPRTIHNPSPEQLEKLAGIPTLGTSMQPVEGGILDPHGVLVDPPEPEPEPVAPKPTIPHDQELCARVHNGLVLFHREAHAANDEDAMLIFGLAAEMLRAYGATLPIGPVDWQGRVTVSEEPAQGGSLPS